MGEINVRFVLSFLCVAVAVAGLIFVKSLVNKY